MRITVAIVAVLIGMAVADKPAPTYKKGSVSSLEKKPIDIVEKKVADKRSDSYGPPASPAAAPDTYGAPQSPAQDSYGPPQSPAQDSYGPPQTPAQKGEVGTQGYYYYYYPVGNNQQTQSYSASAPTYATASSGGGFLGGSFGIILIVGLGLLAVLGLVAAFSGATGRSLPIDMLYSLDTEQLVQNVFTAIELYSDFKELTA